MLNDGYNEAGTRERKLIWDEENRLSAVDDNGWSTVYFSFAFCNMTFDFLLVRLWMAFPLRYVC